MHKITENEDRRPDGSDRCLVRVEHIADNCWRAKEWSAFLVCLLMPNRGVLRCYTMQDQAVAELTDIGLSELKNRSLSADMDDNQAVFSIPFPGTLSDEVFLSWKKKLSPSFGE